MMKVLKKWSSEKPYHPPPAFSLISASALSVSSGVIPSTLNFSNSSINGADSEIKPWFRCAEASNKIIDLFTQ